MEGEGLSPRGRGNLLNEDGRGERRRSIPAWAGEPDLVFDGFRLPWVYPRVGGGTALRRRVHAVRRGLSPRGRGNPTDPDRERQRDGSIPAWAGEPMMQPAPSATAEVYPRVGGGTTVDDAEAIQREGLSPRGRGNQRWHNWILRAPGSIPAWAGEPAWHGGVFDWWRVYPRVGGGTSTSPNRTFTLMGLSPRGRGNLRTGSATALRSRSIPAWAGEPLAAPRVAHLAQVYPRVGGGTGILSHSPKSPWGLSPRGRGNHRRGAT